MGGINFQSLGIRFVSAAILIPVVLGILVIGGLPFMVLLALIAAVSICEWWSVSGHIELPKRNLYRAAGVLYIIGSFVCCYHIFETFGFYWSMIFLVMIWASDIGAYFAGKIIGGAKMAVKISPNKTWAGLGGALLAPAIAGFIAVFIYQGVNDFSFSWAFLIACIGLVMGLSGQSGDLLISSFKRQAGVKDTGAIIPGHGGVLDRIDSMLLAAPIYLVLMSLV